MKAPRVVAKANKVITNPIQRTWAPRLAPWAMVEHVGRKSGKQYSIPVLAWVSHDRVSIPLVYGTESDWVRNVLAAGSFTMVRGGKRLKVAGARVLPPDSPDIAGFAKYATMPFEGAMFGRIVRDASHQDTAGAGA